jgi:hypothetical protein
MIQGQTRFQQIDPFKLPYVVVLDIPSTMRGGRGGVSQLSEVFIASGGSLAIRIWRYARISMAGFTLP